MEVQPSDAMVLENLKKMAESVANEASRQVAMDANTQNNNDIYHPQKNAKSEITLGLGDEMESDDAFSIMNHYNGEVRLEQRPLMNGIGPKDEEPMEMEGFSQEASTKMGQVNGGSPRGQAVETSPNGMLTPEPTDNGEERVVTPCKDSHPLTPQSNSPPASPHNWNQSSSAEAGKKPKDSVECGECCRVFTEMQDYIDHPCKPTSKLKDLDTEAEILSDVESFDGKIVYNPDGSAYIIEGESDLSESESPFDVPRLEGSIVVDTREKMPPTSQVPSFPQIANAFYIQRNPAAFYNTFYMFPPEQRPKVEAPIMHSFRVFDVRSGKNQKDKDESCYEDTKMSQSSDAGDQDVDAVPAEIASVPTKPILMCFICKLSFGFAKSFTAHAIGEHGMSLNEEEKELMARKNASAIIQGLGKGMEPLMSFLEPSASSGVKSQSTEDEPPPFISPAYSSSNPMNTSVSYMYGSVKPTPSEQKDIKTSGSPSQDSSDSDTKDSAARVSPRAATHHSPSASESLAQTSQTSPQQAGRATPKGGDQSAEGNHVPYSDAKPVASSSPNEGFPAPNLLSSPSPLSMAIAKLSMSSPHTSIPQPSYTTSSPYMMSAACEEHPNGSHPGVECGKCDMMMTSPRSMGGHMAMMHSRNSCKTLKCPKCNWHYKYQETLEIHMKEKHPDNDAQCLYCMAGQPHPRLARGEVYTCGYKPYRCDVCNYSTTTKGNLSIHMQSDKHINNMQELQNGSGEMKLPPPQPQAPPVSMMQSPIDPNKNKKPKPTWRCDVCNYETNVARNLRIHMTSEKHTHNMMVLQQNVKHMQRDMHFQLTQMAMLGQEPGMVPGMSPQLPPHAPAAMPPFPYDPALFMGPFPGQYDPTVVDLPKEQPQMPGQPGFPLDMKNNNNEPGAMFQCSVCSVFSTDSIEALHAHLQADRSKTVAADSVSVHGATYVCNLCQYKTTLKANFQLHCKTDKHLQRLQLVNHIREGGPANEWRLKYITMSNPTQVRCNACDYYTNSVHKLQLHAAAPRHQTHGKIWHHLVIKDATIPADRRYYHCAMCGFSTRAKLNLIQHTRAMKHMRQMNLLAMNHPMMPGQEAEYDLTNTFLVKELNEGELIKFDEPGKFSLYI